MSGMNVLALSGSLRAESTNAALLRAAIGLAPPAMVVTICDCIGALPPFNPDLDEEGAVAPPAVATFRDRLRAAEGFVISSPEYAHGVPGSFKNALDWTVSSGELMDKPVLLLNAARAGGERAQASLADTLTMLSARVLLEASRSAPFLSGSFDSRGALSEPADASLVAVAMQALADAIRKA